MPAGTLLGMLTLQEIGQFLSHEQRPVRDQALRSLALAGNQSDVPADLALAAMERLGTDAFTHPRQVGALAPTEPSVEQAFRVAQKQGPLRQAGEQVLLDLPQDVLTRHVQQVAEMPAGSLRLRLEARLALGRKSPDDLWRELEQCPAGEGHDLILALVSLDTAVSARVSDILSKNIPGPLEAHAVELAGRMRLAASLASLVDRLASSDPQVAQAAEIAVGRIGNAGAVTMLEQRCNSSAATIPFRLHAARSLGHFRVPSAEAAALRMLAQEDAPEVINELCQAMADMGTTIGFARLQEAAGSGKCGQATRASIAALDTMLKAHAARPAACSPAAPRPAAQPAGPTPQFCQLGEEDNVFVEPDTQVASAPAPQPPAAPIRRGEQKVGRNDPCPCGSGKKYKKCCGA